MYADTKNTACKIYESLEESSIIFMLNIFTDQDISSNFSLNEANKFKNLNTVAESCYSVQVFEFDH